MSDSRSNVTVFGKLTIEQTRKLERYFDECTAALPNRSEVEQIIQNCLGHLDVERILFTYYGFMIAGCQKSLKIIDDAELDPEKKRLLKNTVKKIHEKIDSDDVHLKNKHAFEEFKKQHLSDPSYAGKFAVFVDGKLQDVSDAPNPLIKKIYDKFGNVDMYVDQITDIKHPVIIDTPEFN